MAAEVTLEEADELIGSHLGIAGRFEDRDAKAGRLRHTGVDHLWLAAARARNSP